MAESMLVASGPCYLCGILFPFDPDLVPSYDPSLDNPNEPQGKRPICSDCIGIVNRERVKAGKSPWEIPEGAYLGVGF